MKILSMLLALLMLAVPAAAQEKLTAEDVANVQWMNYYYFHKDAARTPQFLAFVDRTIEQHPQAVEPTAVFLSFIFDAHQDKVAGWLKDTKFNGKAKDVVSSALWQSGGKDKIKLIGGDPAKYSGTAPKVASRAIKTPADLDLMWGAFFATGQDVYIKKVIGTLDESKALSGDKDADAATRKAAAWSLASNAMQHETVNRVIRQESALAKGQMKTALDTIGDDIRGKVTPFPNKDGDFSATLIPTNVDAVKAFDSPNSEQVQISEKTQLKPEEPVALIIVFSGMDLDKELNADVTYDMTVMGPDGKVYDNFSEKNLEALKTRLPSRYRVFHNGYYPVLKFAAKDAPGKYTVKANLRDNVSKKVLTWSKEIELKANDEAAPAAGK